MKPDEQNLQADVAAVQKIPIVPLLLDVVCRTTGMGFAAIARVTDERWIACSVLDKISFGVKPGGELQVETTLCQEVRHSREPVIIEEVARDQKYARHHTPAMYGFQSYISFPIFLRDGRFFGTLCAIDPRPANLDNPETIGMFKLFTDLLSFHLQTEETLSAAEAKLMLERKNNELREQFIAILGHDLKNPATAIVNGAELLLRMPLDNTATRTAMVIKNSSYRMLALVENLLDFARGRLGSGISLSLKPCGNLAKQLQQIIAESKTIWPNRLVEAEIDITEKLYCDENRIGQLFSNLLGNAFVHGSINDPINVKAYTVNGNFILSVSNAGTKIPPAAIEHLFKPFTRGDFRPGQQGLGLGLYISSQIAQAHDGALDVISTNEETTFTFKMPLVPTPAVMTLDSVS